MKIDQKMSPSRELASKVLFAAACILKEHGGSLPSADVISEVAKRVKFDPWALHVYEKTGYIRWQSLLHFFSIDASKAGFLIKKKGIWYLTPEGEKAISVGEKEFFKQANQAYKKWRSQQPDKESESDCASDLTIESDSTAIMDLERAEEFALIGIRRAIEKKSAYEFQDLVGALLRAMGYYTPFVAPRGKDGGIDIVAYRDPIGAIAPRIKVQVKHRDQPSSVAEIRELMGLLSKEGDSGLFVSTGGFSPDARSAVRNSHVHVELVNLERFIQMWIELFDKMPEEDQMLLSIVPVYFAS